MRNMKKTTEVIKTGVPIINAPADAGLTAEQALLRLESGWGNTPVEPPTKTVWQIVASNVLTYFNFIFFLLAACVAAVGSWLNLTFMGIVLVNTGIGIIQELRSKKTLDKLSILSAPRATVVRDGQEMMIESSQTVRDDIVVFSAGNQIYADAVVVDGSVQVNEALITGEADEIKKTEGSKLLSGSFVISGSCRARLTAVGAESFVSRLTLEAKRSKKPQSSEMMRSLTKLVKLIGIIVIPFGIILFIKEINWLGRDVTTAVTSTVGAIIGMIPEGLYLLTSLALVAGTLRLARRDTLCHDMECIETLARVDVLCVDKTGTITENKMVVEDVIPLEPERNGGEEIRDIMADYVYAMQADNDTMQALKKYFTGQGKRQARQTAPFTSVRKYGAVSFGEGECYYLGAPDIMLGGGFEQYREQVEYYFARGCRVILLGRTNAAELSAPAEEQAVEGLEPLALILLNNKIRAQAPATFGYFAEQGVTIKVISGDNPITVSEVARRAGVADAEKYVDARTLVNDVALRRAAETYTVFGRVTPEQKRKLVQALKACGHTVAMTGDGVNDVLALKAADCSVAMASGSDVACQVSHIVLMNSDFSAMPSVVEEGRRVINNIERSAALFLVKNIFSFILAIITLFFALPYPFSPAQLSLVNALTIGIPSFILAMEPNKNMVKGHFLRNVMYRALPAALTNVALVVGVLMFYLIFRISDGALSSICTAVMGVVGLIMVHRTSKPYNKIRLCLITGMSLAFAVAFIFLKPYFTLSPMEAGDVLVLAVFALLAKPMMNFFAAAMDGISLTVRRIARGERLWNRKA